MIINPGQIRPPSDADHDQWARLSSEAARFLAVVYKAADDTGNIPYQSYRHLHYDQPTITIRPGCGGDTAFFNPLADGIEVNPGLQRDLDVTTTSLLLQSARLRVPVLSGAVLHEIMHSIHSVDLHNLDWVTDLAPWDRQLQALWEESRIEAKALSLVSKDAPAHARTRTLLRASSAAVTNWDCDPETTEWNRANATSAICLVVARCDIGLLTDTEIQPLVTSLVAGGLPESNLARLRHVITEYRWGIYHHRQGPPFATEIERLITEWRAAISVLPAPAKAEEPGGGCGGVVVVVVGGVPQAPSTEPPAPAEDPAEDPSDSNGSGEGEEPQEDDEEPTDADGGDPTEDDQEDGEGAPEADSGASDEDPDDESEEEPDSDLDEDIEGDSNEASDDSSDDATEGLDNESDTTGGTTEDNSVPDEKPKGLLDEVSEKAQNDEAPQQAEEAAVEEQRAARRARVAKVSKIREFERAWKATAEGGEIIQ